MTTAYGTTDGEPPLPFTIVVQTCYEHAATTLPVLLESLETVGVPLSSSLLVVCGQCPADSQGDPVLPGYDGSYRVVPVGYAAGALTGLVCVSERPALVATPWLLYIRDTMAAGEEFLERALEAYRQICDTPSTSQAPVRCVKLLDRASMGVGFYDTRWLGSLDLVGCKGKGGRAAPDEVFDLCPAECAKYIGEFDNPEHRQVLGEFRYSEAAAARTIEHYPALDLYKFKCPADSADPADSTDF